MVYALENGLADVSQNMFAHCCGRYDSPVNKRTPGFIAFYRYQLIDFTRVVSRREFSVAYYPPDLASDIFLKQFAPEVWVKFLLMVGVLAVSMYLIFHVRRRLNTAKGDKKSLKSFQHDDILDWLFGKK